jgi:hypothetical protein
MKLSTDRFRSSLITLAVLPALVALATCRAGTAPEAVGGAAHVVVLGFDGMGTDGVQRAATPVMQDLMKRGAYTLHARGVFPTVSSPNWASMIMGAGPEQHGVTSNDWQPDKFQIAPVCTGSGGIFPTIFGLLRQQRPTAVIGVFHDWDGFGRLLEAKAPDLLKDGDGPDNTMDLAIAFVKEKKPALTFVQCDHVDHAGHEYGWGTPEYYASVAKADALVGKMLAALDEVGIARETIVLVAADHGGVGKKHGGMTVAELEIPWIIAGPGVAAGKGITGPVSIVDTAATIAYVLGLTPPSCWTGKPVVAAFALTAAKAKR